MTAPAGILFQLPLQLQDLLAASSAFQDWLGVESAAEAEALIGFFEDRAPTAGAAGDKLGFVVPGTIRGMRDNEGTGPAAFAWGPKSASWGLEWRVSAFSTENTTLFLNLAGEVLEDILEAATARNLVEVEQWPPERCPLRIRDGATLRYQIAFTMSTRQST